jgi:glucokinase
MSHSILDLHRRALQPEKPVSRGPSVLRDINLRTILRLLREHDQCSCSDLARNSGLSMPTVAGNVARLERIGLAKRVGTGNSSGGRPPRLLRFNHEYGYAVGVDITESRIRVGIANLAGEVAGELSVDVGEKSWPMAVVEQVAAVVGELRESLRIPAKRLLAMGVAVPGITDVDSGTVVAVPTMQGWENVPLGRLLEEKVRIPVTVENDVNLAALGEHWYGTAQGERNFVFVHLGRGVGAGLFINGQLHHGPEWTAGEIGYLLVPSSGIQAVRKSQGGALEREIGTCGIERQWNELAAQAAAPPAEPLRAVEVLDRAAAGDPVARQILDSVSQRVAMVCSHLSLILNCSLIVFGGELGVHPALLPVVARLLEAHDFAHPRLTTTQLGVKAELHGALRLALESAEAALV